MNDLTTKQKLHYSTILNIGILIFIIFLVVKFRDDESKYFRFGPQEDLSIAGVKLNTVTKYIMFLAIVAIIKVAEVFVDEFGIPVIDFNIYDPNHKTIKEIKKKDLKFYAHLLYFTRSVRGLLLMIVSITQFDIGLFSILIEHFTGIFTIDALLNNKTFKDK
tara:strand:+ start:1719 stop:2204 length:486 start_codon:yes stop_codon:yes gene_type:complete